MPLRFILCTANLAVVGVRNRACLDGLAGHDHCVVCPRDVSVKVSGLVDTLVDSVTSLNGLLDKLVFVLFVTVVLQQVVSERVLRSADWHSEVS